MMMVCLRKTKSFELLFERESRSLYSSHILINITRTPILIAVSIESSSSSDNQMQ